MPEMNKITLPNIGEYTILTYQRSMEEGTLLEGDYTVIFNGSIYSTDIREKIGHVSNGCRYAITEEISPDKKTIVRRIYGTPPEYSYIKATQLQKVYDENADAIEAAVATEEDRQQFIVKLHRTINRAAKEVLGKDSVAYDRVRSTYGDWVNKYCTPILPADRLSIPFIVSYRDGDMTIMLDNTHPAANIRYRDAYVGSRSHGMDTILVERKSDGAKFDLGRSSWPRYIPKNEENIRKVLDYCKEHNNKEIFYEIDVLKATEWGLPIGNYRLVWDRRPAPKMSIYVSPEHLVCTDGSSDHLWLSGTDGEEHYTKVLRTPSYIVTVKLLWKFSPTYVVITTYGEVPPTSGLSILEELWKENADVIDNAASSFCNDCNKYRNDYDDAEALFFNEFLTAVHNHHRDELTGKAEVAYGKYKSKWKGDGYHNLYCVPILPESRETIPLKMDTAYYYDKCSNTSSSIVDLRLDIENPIVGMIKYTGYHKYTNVVVERLSDRIGIDLTHAEWPKDVPQSAENFEKVIAMHGDYCDSINFTMHLSKDQILEAIGK